MANIHKVVNGDELIYPATITDAVGHKETRSPLSDLINYYNADLIWPQAVGTYHTLSEVISKLFDTLEEKHRVSGIQVGFKCSIPGKDPEYQRFEYFGDESGEVRFKQEKYWRRVDSGVLDKLDSIVNPIKFTVNSSTPAFEVTKTNSSVTARLSVTITKGGTNYNLGPDDEVSYTVSNGGRVVVNTSSPILDQFVPNTVGDRVYNFSANIGGKRYTTSFTIKVVDPSFFYRLTDRSSIPSIMLDIEDKGISHLVLTSKNYTSTIDLVDGCTCFIYPKYFGKLTTIKDANNFEYINSYTLTERNLDGVDYYIYALTDPVTITNFKQSFS